MKHQYKKHHLQRFEEYNTHQKSKEEQGYCSRLCSNYHAARLLGRGLRLHEAHGEVVVLVEALEDLGSAELTTREKCSASFGERSTCFSNVLFEKSFVISLS